MSEREKKIMETLSEVVPELSEAKQNYLLGYGEAIVDMKKEKQRKEREEPDESEE